MSKIYGLFGAMTGKLADIVMVVRNGQQIARKYQPVISNPSSQAQVAQRAKLKLASQLSATLAPVIGFRKKGSVSPRNRFTAANLKLMTYESNKANLQLTNVDLTGSSVYLPNLSADVEAGVSISSWLSAPAPSLSRVVYALCQVVDSEFRLVEYGVSETPGDSNTFSYVFSTTPAVGDNYVVLSYGVRDNTDAARARFSDMVADSTTGYPAFVEVLRSLTEVDVTLTETKSAAISVAE